MLRIKNNDMDMQSTPVKISIRFLEKLYTPKGLPVEYDALNIIQKEFLVAPLISVMDHCMIEVFPEDEVLFIEAWQEKAKQWYEDNTERVEYFIDPAYGTYDLPNPNLCPKPL